MNFVKYSSSASVIRPSSFPNSLYKAGFETLALLQISFKE